MHSTLFVFSMATAMALVVVRNMVLVRVSQPVQRIRLTPNAMIEERTCSMRVRNHVDHGYIGQVSRALRLRPPKGYVVFP